MNSIVVARPDLYKDAVYVTCISNSQRRLHAGLPKGIYGNLSVRVNTSPRRRTGAYFRWMSGSARFLNFFDHGRLYFERHAIMPYVNIRPGYGDIGGNCALTLCQP